MLRSKLSPALWSACILFPLASFADDTPAPAPATHTQIGTIDLVTPEAGACVINTFCMAPDGRLLVAVGGQQRTIQIVEGERQIVEASTGDEIRVFSGDGQQVAVWQIPFTPQSLNVSPDGAVYVAGAGQVAKLDADGQIVKQGATPQIGNLDEFKAQVRKELEEQQQERAKTFEAQIEQAEEIVQKLQDTPEEDRSAIDKLRLRNAEKQLELLKEQTEFLAEQTIDIDYYMSYKLKVPGLAVSDKDVFVAVSSLNGYGYDVWRMDHDFNNPTQIVTGMRGCCGQMDIQCQNGDLYVAENSRHRVCRYDRDGEMITQWGKSDRTGSDGFEGCCNPMNLRFANGEVLTAESGNGAIKRFNTDGEFLGLLGNADLTGGCKHVAVAAKPDGSRVYMLDVPRSKIAILAPRSDSDPVAPPAAGAAAKPVPNATARIPAARLQSVRSVLRQRTAPVASAEEVLEATEAESVDLAPAEKVKVKSKSVELLQVRSARD